LTNSRSANHNPGAQSGTENHRQSFVEAGYSLYEYQPPESSLHTKTLIVDEEIVAVGAYNFDARSSYLNTDNMVVLESPGLANEIAEKVERSYMPRSPRIDEDGNEIDDGEVLIRDEPMWKRIWVPMLRPLTRIFESLM
jgi:putative cardiolipin synthase